MEMWKCGNDWFNFNIVRFLVSDFIQFQYGTIKSVALTSNAIIFIEFQFQYGTIKSLL